MIVKKHEQNDDAFFLILLSVTFSMRNESNRRENHSLIYRTDVSNDCWFAFQCFLDLNLIEWKKEPSIFDSILVVWQVGIITKTSHMRLILIFPFQVSSVISDFSRANIFLRSTCNANQMLVHLSQIAIQLVYCSCHDFPFRSNNWAREEWREVGEEEEDEENQIHRTYPKL